jgi:hypothetical protein
MSHKNVFSLSSANTNKLLDKNKRLKNRFCCEKQARPFIPHTLYPSGISFKKEMASWEIFVKEIKKRKKTNIK